MTTKALNCPSPASTTRPDHLREAPAALCHPNLQPKGLPPRDGDSPAALPLSCPVSTPQWHVLQFSLCAVPPFLAAG